MPGKIIRRRKSELDWTELQTENKKSVLQKIMRDDSQAEIVIHKYWLKETSRVGEQLGMFDRK